MLPQQSRRPSVWTTPMKTLRLHQRKSAGFAPSGCIERLLLAHIVAAVLNFALGNWIFATAMLAPLAGLFFWTQYTDRRNRCKTGDKVRVRLGPHSGMEGVVVGSNEAGTPLTVPLSSAEHPAPMEFFVYRIRKVKPMTE